MATSQGIKLDDTTRQRLKTLAAQRNRSPHWLMKAAIEEYLAKEEQYEQEKAEDMARWERYIVTGKAIEQNPVEKWLQDLANGTVSKCPK